MHYSYSRLSTFECPYRFNQKYNLKKQEPEGDLLVVGRICHDVIYNYSNHLREIKQNTDFSSIPEIIDKCLAVHKGYAFADEITDIIIRFSKTFMLHDTIYDIEHKFGLDRDLVPVGWPKNPSGWNYVFFVGKIDRIDTLNEEHIKITDYKSGWSTDTDKFQLQLYALALSRIFPKAQKFTIELDFIRFGIQKQSIITLEDIIKTKKKLFKLVEEIESTTRWEPRPGDACKWCGFLDSCPAMKNALGNPVDGNILVEDQARRAAESILLLTARLDAYRKSLQEWVKARGPVIHNGYQFGYNVKESDEITEITKLIEELALYVDADLNQYLTLAAANKKKLKKDYPEVYEKFREIKKSTKWGVKKMEAKG